MNERSNSLQTKPTRLILEQGVMLGKFFCAIRNSAKWKINEYRHRSLITVAKNRNHPSVVRFDGAGSAATRCAILLFDVLAHLSGLSVRYIGCPGDFAGARIFTLLKPP
jgi:hypothetical protein